ncbi:MAG: pyrroline-5-carboxylate reductase [Bdellovibrionales bacterium]
MTKTQNITLIGCGRMGGAMLQGWLKAGLNANYLVIEPYGKPDFLDQYDNADYAESIEAAGEPLAQSDICILAVKPQVMADICASLKPLIAKTCLIASVAAGQSIGNFESYFGADQPIIRIMPNTPAAIGKGMSAAVANPRAGEDQKHWITTLLNCSGKTQWLEDENLMNAVTAVSGSGPAYVFYVIEAMAKAGEKLGLTPDQAMILARQTVVGAAALAENQADTTAKTLRENVTSPNGTTQAALDVLMNGDMQDIFNSALKAARDRGVELSA